MVTAEMAITMHSEDLDIDITQRADDQESARYLCDDYLEDELIAADIDFEEIDIERTDGDEFKVNIWGAGWDLIGEGNISMEEL